MSSLVERWGVEQQHAGLIAGSIRRRCDDLRGFQRFMDGVCVLDATKDDVNAWLGSRGLSSKTRYNLLSTLSCFYQWAMREDLTDRNPAAAIRRPKLRRYLPRPMPPNDLDVAISSATPRMRTWLLLGSLAGLRCMEIANLDRQDLHPSADPPVMIVRGKGDKERVVPMHELIVLSLQEVGASGPGPVFRNGRGKRFTPAAVSQQINAYLHGLGIEATAHQLRHRFGTDVYAMSRDLRMTQELLGHASPATTAVYAAWSPKESAEVVRKLESPATSSHPVFRQLH